MTRVVWLTDLHLNFVGLERVEQFLDEIIATESASVLIGGDVGEAETLATYLAQFDSRLKRPIYFVLGNHDFYKGSIPVVREAIRQLCREHPDLHYLTQLGVIELTPRVGLIGHDGWADARYGDYENSDVILTDYALIAELAGHFQLDRRPTLERRLIFTKSCQKRSPASSTSFSSRMCHRCAKPAGMQADFQTTTGHRISPAKQWVTRFSTSCANIPNES